LRLQAYIEIVVINEKPNQGARQRKKSWDTLAYRVKEYAEEANKQANLDTLMPASYFAYSAHSPTPKTDIMRSSFYETTARHVSEASTLHRNSRENYPCNRPWRPIGL
jgi:hypothetical protein